MVVGISAFAGDGGKSGISQYMIQLFRRMADQAPDDRFILFMAKGDEQFLDPCCSNVTVVLSPAWVGHPLVNIFWHLLVLPFVLRQHGCDCVFMPAGNRRLAWYYGVPSVGTVHDMSQLHVQAKYDALRMQYIMRVLPRMMNKLDRVVAISHATRKDLEGFAGVPPERIRVVYNGADLQRFKKPDDLAEAKRRVQEKLKLPADFVLYTSRLEHPGKNHVRLIEAFARMKEETGLPHKLVLVGSRWNGAEAIDAAVEQFAMQHDVIFPGFVADEFMPDLYAAADLFVFPSLFDGFGIPVLEAMASGTAVCASNAASIPEVVGDAGLLFAPADVDEMAAAMARLLMDSALRQEMALRGLQQAQSFSWDRAATELLQLCHDLQTV